MHFHRLWLGWYLSFSLRLLLLNNHLLLLAYRWRWRTIQILFRRKGRSIMLLIISLILIRRESSFLLSLLSPLGWRDWSLHLLLLLLGRWENLSFLLSLFSSLRLFTTLFLCILLRIHNGQYDLFILDCSFVLF